MTYGIEDVDDLLDVLADLYEGAREKHWIEAYALAEAVDGIAVGSYALNAVDRDAFLAYLKELFA